MAKWADYLISAVRFEETATTKHISQVRVHADNDSSVGGYTIWTRQEVIKNLDAGKTFKTIFKDTADSGSWKQGETVIKVWIVNAYYIKTKADNTAKDNLDNLPTF